MSRNYSIKENPKFNDQSLIWDEENSGWKRSPLSAIKHLFSTVFGTGIKSTIDDADLFAIKDSTVEGDDNETSVTAETLKEYVLEGDAYSVEEQYTIGDQTVTKWSNGDMEISGERTISRVIINPTGSLFRDGQLTNSYLEAFMVLPIINLSLLEPSTSIVSIIAFASSLDGYTSLTFATVSQTVDVTEHYVVKGKWK